MKRILVGNWKMNLGPGSSATLASEIRSSSQALSKSEVWVAPSFPCISTVVQALSGSQIRIGAQNVHWADKGAFTAEVSAVMLKECGCSFTIVGHSERRHVFNESNEEVIKRAKASLTSGLTTIFCIGEKLSDREAGDTGKVLSDQLKPFLAELNATLAKNTLIAYEPVWAIGTGKVATEKQIAETHAEIAQLCRPMSLPILYGGSVSPANLKEILSVPLVAGGLIGGASLTADSFRQLIQISEGLP